MINRLWERLGHLAGMLRMVVVGKARLLVKRRSLAVGIDLGRDEIKRYVIQLVKGLNRDGESVVVAASVRSLLNFQRTKKEILDDPDTYVLPRLPNQVGSQITVERSRSETTHLLSFDVFAADRQEPYIFWPQTIHPAFLTIDYGQRIASARRSDRDIGVLFAGNISPKVYDNPITAELFGILTRHEYISTLRSHFDKSSMVFPGSYEEFNRDLEKGVYAQKIVICDASTFRIPHSEWFEVLGRARYFLSPPGVLQPFCHNTVEAMAVGAVPILQYPEVYQPDLSKAGAAVAFRDGTELLDLMADARSLGKEPGWQDVSAGAIRYYENYLSPESFHERFYASRPSEDQLTIYICQNRISTNLEHRRRFGVESD